MCEFDPRADYVNKFRLTAAGSTYLAWGKNLTPEGAKALVKAEFGAHADDCQPHYPKRSLGRDGYRKAHPEVWKQFPAMGH